jgi:hypothetical protein
MQLDLRCRAPSQRDCRPAEDEYRLEAMSLQRKPPFDQWAVHHADPRYGYAWYLGRGLIVSHMTITHGTEAAAHAYHDFESAVLRDCADEVTENGGIYVIHDWRAIVTYDSAARRTWQERMQARKKGYLRGSVVCLVRTAPLLKMAVQGANLVASVTHGAKVELSTNIDATLAAHGAVPERIQRGRVKV